MAQPSALPFILTRSDDVFGGGTITSTAETIHGLLRLDADMLVIQWRLTRTVDRMGAEIRSDQEVEPVREVSIPLRAVAAAAIRESWWPWASTVRCVLTAADMRAFEPVVGATGLKLDHPAEIVLRVRRADRDAARLFAGDLELALAERALRDAESESAGSRLPDGTPEKPSLGSGGTT
jgi:hypothetical protein